MAGATLTSMTSPMNRMTWYEAIRALYIDFEGNKDQPPTLLGCARRSKGEPTALVTHVVTESTFAPLAEADALDVRSLPEAIEHILRRAESKDRRIVAWTTHELEIVREYCPEQFDRFAARYVNARAVAEWWRNKVYAGGKPESGTLAAYLTLIGYEVPDGAGVGLTGATLGLLRKALESGKTAEDLTDSQRRRWAAVRDHNRHDCLGMRRVCLTASSEIEAAAERRRDRPGRKEARRRTLTLAAAS